MCPRRYPAHFLCPSEISSGFMRVRFSSLFLSTPVVPHEAVAKVSRIGIVMKRIGEIGCLNHG